jgi:hypothetical protein
MDLKIESQEIEQVQENRSAKTILFFIGFLICFSFLAVYWFNSTLTLQNNSKRNPGLKNFWVEHTYQTNLKQLGEALVIVISNSQGYAKGLPDHQIYPSLLEQSLNSNPASPVRVLNWSIWGGKGPEFILLAAAASRLNPDALILVAGAESFSARHMIQNAETGSHLPWGSDTSLLLGYSEVREKISSSYLTHFFNLNDALEITVARLWPPWRFRHLPLEKTRNSLGFYLPVKNLRKKLLPYGQIHRDFRQQQMDLDRIQYPVSEKLLDWFIDATAGISGRMIFVEIPRCDGEVGTRTLPGYEIQTFFQDHGFETWEFPNQLSREDYQTPLYFSVKGHQRFADLLAGRL